MSDIPPLRKFRLQFITTLVNGDTITKEYTLDPRSPRLGRFGLDETGQRHARLFIDHGVRLWDGSESGEDRASAQQLFEAAAEVIAEGVARMVEQERYVADFGAGPEAGQEPEPSIS